METGFFKWVWRFNAVLICLGALLIVGIILWEITRDLRRHGLQAGDWGPDAIAPTESKDDDEPTLRFGSPSARAPIGLHAVPLYTKQEYSGYSISKSSSGALINYLVVNTSNERRRWLFPNTDRRILQTTPLAFRNNNSETKLGHILTVIEVDTNNDGQLSRLDTQTIYLIDQQWSEPQKILDGVTAILVTEAVSKDAFDLIVTTEDRTRALRIDAASANILSQQTFSTRD
jgi:hypothetical protein